MITVAKNTDIHTITMSIRRPAIYLDHWALRCFSSDPQRRNKFIAFFKTQGTLLFSLANVIEITGNTGRSAQQIWRFLAEVGEQWFPIAMNPFTVIDREKGNLPGNDNPSFDIDFATAYYPYIHNGSLSLSTIADLTQDDQEKPGPESIQALTAEICQFVRSGRDQYLSNPAAANDAFPDVPFDSDRPTQFTYNRLMRLVCKETFRFENRDALDFCHATVSLAYGDFVLLDKRWANLAGKLGIPPDRARVYSKPQIDQFLQDLFRKGTTDYYSS